MKPSPKVITLFCILSLSLLSAHAAEISDARLQYILNRYAESMGGRANLEKFVSVRMTGKLTIEGNPKKADIVILKKQPDSVRITTLFDDFRIVQGYDGNEAWMLRRKMGRTQIRKMEGEQRNNFIRQAPLEDPLLSPKEHQGTIELVGSEEYFGRDCHIIKVTYKDNAYELFYIDKEEFLERRIISIDENGDELSEVIPGEFEYFDGVLFAKRSVQKQNGELKSTIEIESIDINLGILDSTFKAEAQL